MRPLHLEIEGFGPFRQRTELDLSDIELVALVGRTGSGKSTVIDAITFALFGGIPRYGEKTLFPAINQMSNQALVALTFQVGGRTYEAVRKLVRTSNNGATTKEARLGLDDGSEITGVDDIKDAIEKLLGLDFTQFNKAVFLPQGKFADFLQASPTERQRILRGILDFGVFAKVQNLARERAGSLETEMTVLESHLAESADINDDLVANLVFRCKDLETLKSTVQNDLESIGSDSKNLEILRQKQSRVQEQLDALNTLSKPIELDSLADLRNRAKNEVAQLEQQTDKLRRDLDKIDKELEVLNKPTLLISIVDDHKQLVQVQTTLEEKKSVHDQMQEQLLQIEEECLTADKEKNKASEVYDKLLSKSRVSAFAKDLVIGEPCPLCQSEVASIPEHSHDGELDRAKELRNEAALMAEQAFRKKSTTRSEVDALTREIETLTINEKRLKKNLDGTLELMEAERQLKLYDALDTKRKSVSKESQLHYSKLKQARIHLEELDQRADRQRSVFSDARDTLNNLGLKPPGGSSGSIVEGWNDLILWRDEKKNTLAISKSENAESEKAIEAKISQQKTELLAMLERHNIPYEGSFNDRSLSSWVERSHTQVEQQLSQAQKTLKRKKEALDELGQKAKKFKTYKSLSKNLEPRRFEAWLMQEVLEELAEGATGHLFALSGGAYSLELDKKEFVVRDHHNADEIRVAKSLSGGETFLASLSLALSLSDSIAGMAAEGTAKLESLFLDEGFGTLDSETLDIVASSIEELGSEGRMIGIVTHVEEIAQRMPVRFKVTKGSETSFVERQES